MTRILITCASYCLQSSTSTCLNDDKPLKMEECILTDGSVLKYMTSSIFKEEKQAAGAHKSRELCQIFAIENIYL